MDKEKKIIAYHDFGVCPRCGNRMMYMISTYQLGIPSSGGTTLKAILGEDRDITGVCPNCNHKVAMTSSLYGITTKEYAKLKEDQSLIEKRKHNRLIGYIDE